MGRNDYAVYAVFSKTVVKVEPFEACLVNQVNLAVGKPVLQVLLQQGILRFHGCLVNQHALTPHSDPPGLLRILETNEHFFAFDHEILYLIDLHLATSLSLN